MIQFKKQYQSKAVILALGLSMVSFFSEARASYNDEAGFPAIRQVISRGINAIQPELRAIYDEIEEAVGVPIPRPFQRPSVGQRIRDFFHDIGRRFRYFVEDNIPGIRPRPIHERFLEEFGLN